MSSFRYLFGPVPSRRFGRSLGVDLVPAKTCTEDCVFCQLGRTASTTLARRDYVPIADVLAELGAWLDGGGEADFITLAGSGEPTLHLHFGDVLAFVHSRTGIHTALLSNGSLMFDPDVRASACLADVVKVSLSAWDQESFGRVNHPHSGLSFERMLAAYRALRQEHRGRLWVEVVLVRGMNSAPEAVDRIAALARDIAPDRIHLNTPVRPPAERTAEPLTEIELRELAGRFTPAADVVAEFGRRAAVSGAAPDEAAIEALVRRHPSTAEQLADVAGIPLTELASRLGAMVRSGRLRAEARGGETYYVAGSGR